jgi:hypothetical protein
MEGLLHLAATLGAPGAAIWLTLAVVLGSHGPEDRRRVLRGFLL